MNIIIIGEAATRLLNDYPELVDRYPDVPWRSMRGMRNRMAHGYFDINFLDFRFVHYENIIDEDRIDSS